MKKIDNKNLAQETPTESKIFELFYVMGDRRNLNQLLPLAKKIDSKVSYQRIKNMKSRLFWYDRIKSRDYNQIVSMRQSAMHDIESLKLEFFEAIKNTIKREFKTIKGETQFKVIIKDINDLEKSIKLMLLLAGEATDIHSVKIEVVETIIQSVINVVSLHIKDPKVLADIALGLKGIERS